MGKKDSIEMKRYGLIWFGNECKCDANVVPMTDRFLFFFVVQLGPKAEDVKGPWNPFSFLYRFMLGNVAALYYVLVPIYMWIKDQIFPKGQAI